MKKITTVLLAVMLCSATFAGINDDLYEQYYKKAVEQVSQGDLVGARDSFESALTFKPGDADAQKGIRLCDERLNKKPQSRPVTRPTREASSYTQPARSAKASNEPSGQTAISVLYFSPKDDDTYDTAFGVEAQGRFWANKNFGWAISAGVSKWDINDQSIYDYPASVSAAEFGGPANWTVEGLLSGSIKGDISAFPLGASVLFREKFADNITFVLEGGFRYVIVDSGVTARGTATNLEVYDENGVFLGPLSDFTGFSEIDFSEDLEIDNGFVGVIGANLEIEASDAVDVLIGVGYQFDISEGDVEFLDEKLGENELEAFYVRAGVAINF